MVLIIVPEFKKLNAAACCYQQRLEAQKVFILKLLNVFNYCTSVQQFSSFLLLF